MIVTTVITMMLGASVQADQAKIDFMSGYWLSCGGGREVIEVWTTAYDNLRVGQGVTLDKGKASFEQFRIAPYEEGLAYFAQPQGQEATIFKLTEATASKAVFSNPAHDFPQAIIYERKGDVLMARIEGRMGGEMKSMEWRYDRAELNTRCPKAK